MACDTEEPRRPPGQPVIDSRAVPALTASQMREVDRIMAEDLHIELVQMMENAGRSLAELALRRFQPSTVTVLAGPGGNGGGGLVAARHLANRGAGVQVTLSHARSELGAVPAHQLDIVARMGIEVSSEPQPAALVVDALIGCGLRGDPGGRTAELIDWANAQASVTLALDNPSGLDVTRTRRGALHPGDRDPHPRPPQDRACRRRRDWANCSSPTSLSRQLSTAGSASRCRRCSATTRSSSSIPRRRPRPELSQARARHQQRSKLAKGRRPWINTPTWW
ncbi:MAG TPA: NAD(P)H-hydrate epimerase [Streptosporangiaceae bacterium]